MINLEARANVLFLFYGCLRGIHYFFYFCSKHRLWVLVRTASQFLGVPTIYVLSRNMKKSEFLSETFSFWW